MRTLRLLFMVLVALLLTLPPQVSATQVYQYARASAFGMVSHTTSCSEIEVIIGVTEGSDKVPHVRRDRFSFAHVEVIHYDTCRNTLLMSARGLTLLTQPAFKVRGNLAGAGLQAIVPVDDWVSQSSFDVRLDLQWVATGEPVIEEKQQYRLRDPNCALNIHLRGVVRPAQAMGTVTIGAQDIPVQTTAIGNLSDVDSGTVVLDCPGYG